MGLAAAAAAAAVMVGAWLTALTVITLVASALRSPAFVEVLQELPAPKRVIGPAVAGAVRVKLHVAVPPEKAWGEACLSSPDSLPCPSPAVRIAVAELTATFIPPFTPGPPVMVKV